VSVDEQPQDQQRSLYRRHRPRTFAEVVGQEPVVRTLRNAVERGKVHHAYLFVGSRGTGKTSMAKILAACLNCERGPTIEPCGECDSCVSIARATSLDVIEMDAASNNSVDDIRELRDSVAYAPVSGRRKVYILDEAHMLSTAAWNAFLKTLEEPPPNTVFVLATTEASKVPATVVDRCHRFDFHRPTVEQIASVVRRAAQAESIEIPPAAVAALARAATGSFRDALGTLEQIVTYSGAEIALEDVLAVLGVADARLLEATVDAVAAGDAAAALRALEECVEQGRDAASFASDLEARARELLVVQILGEVPAELSLTPEADAALSEQAQRVDHATVVRLLDLLGAAMEGVRAGADARTRLELALVKAARPETDGSVRALLARIERLERGDARPDPARPAAPAAPAAMPVTGTPTAATPTVAVPPAADQSEEASASSEEPPSAPEQARAAVPRDIEAVYALWPAVVDLVRSEHALLGAVIGEARPVAVDGEELTLAYPFTAEFYKKKAEDPANRVAVGEALGALAGGRWRLRYELRDAPAGGEQEAAQEHSEEEWIARFVDEFDAEELIDQEAAPPGGASGQEDDAGAREDDERGARAATTSNEKGA
jgi:DNA polymerase-3 subunit gamma/tau